jgi:group II intron reverse transcriptase/maturase
MGSPGIDRVSIEEFESNLTNNLETLLSLLRQNAYHSLPMLKIEVDKSGNGKRTLSIPAIRDRLVQEALLLVLQPLFDRNFLNCSYAYRPGMSAQKAIARIERNIKKGKHWLLDADIENFFDTVDKEILMEFFSQKVSDARVIRIVRECIGMEDEKGIPQGSPLSPLLSNIYLHPLDVEMMKGHWSYIRFADDFIALCEGEEEASEAANRARKVINDRLSLAINESKTKVCRVQDSFVFLGYRFTDKGKSPAGKAIENLKSKIQKEILSSQEKPKIQDKVKSIIRGWLNYFKLEPSDREELMKQLDSIIESQTNSIPAHILKTALCIEDGNREEALEVISRGTELSSEDPELHHQWGILYDTLDLPDQARDEYYLSLRADSSYKETCYSLGLNHLQSGNVEKAIRFLQKAIQLDTSFAEAHFALGTALENWGLAGAAQKAFKQAKQLNPDIKMPKISLEMQEPKEAISYSEDDIKLFLRLFSGREGVFARQWLNPNGRYGYTPVSQPLTEEQIKKHLDGEDTLGLYLMRGDNTVKVAVLDIDVNKSVIQETGADRDTLAGWQKIILRDANIISQLCKEADVPVYIENSGWKGVHCWFFFAEPIRASQVRKFLKGVCINAGDPPAGIHREIFPKQDEVAKDALGCLIKLPLGIHKVTGKRCMFIHNSGEPYEDQLALLRQVKLISKEILSEAKSRLQDRKEPEEDIDDSQVKKVLEKCNVIRYLADKAEKLGDLNHYERLAILYTLGHIGSAGKHYVHKIISHCPNYNQHVTEKWIRRLKPFPISCPKIREMLCDITPSVGCYCEFPKLKSNYPTPLLHADPEYIAKLRAAEGVLGAEKAKVNISREKAEEELPDEPQIEKSLTIDQALRDYLEVKKTMREIELKVKRAETQLSSAFGSTGAEKVQTYLGELSKSEREGRIIWTIEI